MPACSRSGPATTPEKLAPGAFFASAATSAQWLINGLNDDDDDDDNDDNDNVSINSFRVVMFTVCFVVCISAYRPTITSRAARTHAHYAHYVVIVAKSQR